MSPADESKGTDGNGEADQTSVLMQSTSAETPAAAKEPEKPVGNGAALAQRSDDGEASNAVPPWQRMTSEVRRPEEESPYAPMAGYPDTDGYASYSASGSQVLYADNDPTVNNMSPVNPNADTGYMRPDTETPRRPAMDLGGLTGHARQSSSSGGGGGTPSALRRPGRGPRRASLQVKRVDPWSVLKLALVLSVALFFVWLVAVGVLYGVLDGMGVWDKLNGTYSDLVQPGQGGNNAPLISVGRVFSIAAIIGGINIVLMTALSTVAAFIYNVSADLAGGLEITLAERE